MSENFTKGKLYQLPRSKDTVHAEQGNRGRRICCTTSMGDHDENEGNARRIVATWNACAGLSTESLETGPTLMEAHQREERRADTAERDRDELRAALEAIASGNTDPDEMVKLAQEALAANQEG